MITKNTDELLDALKTAQEKQDYESVAKYYLQIGKDYKKKGMTTKALYYLNRFDNLAGGIDSLYDKFAKKGPPGMRVDRGTGRSAYAL